MSNGKAMIIHLMVALIKQIYLYKMMYFPEPLASGNEIKVQLDLSSYATNSDLKSPTGVNTLKLTKMLIQLAEKQLLMNYMLMN